MLRQRLVPGVDVARVVPSGRTLSQSLPSGAPKHEKALVDVATFGVTVYCVMTQANGHMQLLGTWRDRLVLLSTIAGVYMVACSAKRLLHCVTRRRVPVKDIALHVSLFMTCAMACLYAIHRSPELLASRAVFQAVPLPPLTLQTVHGFSLVFLKLVVGLFLMNRFAFSRILDRLWPPFLTNWIGPILATPVADLVEDVVSELLPDKATGAPSQKQVMAGPSVSHMESMEAEVEKEVTMRVAWHEGVRVRETMRADSEASAAHPMGHVVRGRVRRAEDGELWLELTEEPGFMRLSSGPGGWELLQRVRPGTGPAQKTQTSGVAG